MHFSRINFKVALTITALGFATVAEAQTSYSISQPLEDGQFAVVNHGRGQSFTVSAQGQGAGSLGGATQVRLDDVTFMYGQTFQATSAGASFSRLYVYDTLPSNLTDLNTGVGALYTSTSSSSSGFFATHSFTSAFVDTSTTYYLFYNANQQFRYSFATNPYSGGRIWYRQGPTSDWQMTGGADQLDAYFVINTSVIPEPATFSTLAGLAVLGCILSRRRRTQSVERSTDA